MLSTKYTKMHEGKRTTNMTFGTRIKKIGSIRKKDARQCITTETLMAKTNQRNAGTEESKKP